MSDLLKLNTENSKSIVDCYMYILLKKRKNRSHREVAQKHLTNCIDCKKATKEKFFSYTINPLLIQILKEKGYEDYVLFDEKNCCSIMSQQLLKAISYLCKEYKSKSSLWYRNFLVKKFKKNTWGWYQKKSS